MIKNKLTKAPLGKHVSSFFVRSNNFIFVLILLSAFACSREEQKNDEGVKDVKIFEAFNKDEEVVLSDILESNIEYISLESSKEIILGDIIQVFATDTNILAFSSKQIYMFNRQTGKFIREIGHYGNDPGGYKKAPMPFQFDEEKKMVYANGWDQETHFRYSLNGKLYDKIIVSPLEIEPDIQKNIFGEIITSIAPLNDTSFVGYVWNMDGKQDAKLIVFNENNHRIKTYPQYKKFDYDINRDGISIFSWNAKFYKQNNQLHFFERFTDTVFTATMDDLKPKFILQKGMPEDANGTNYSAERGEVDYFVIENIFESSRFLFFKIRNQKDIYFGYFDKNIQQTKVCMNSAGLENDVDNFIPFKFISANNKNELVGFYNTYEITQWTEENPEKAQSLPPRLKKLCELSENDNPVVLIGKLKD